MDEKPKVKHIRTKTYIACIYYEVLLNQSIDELKGGVSIVLECEVAYIVNFIKAKIYHEMCLYKCDFMRRKASTITKMIKLNKPFL